MRSLRNLAIDLMKKEEVPTQAAFNRLKTEYRKYYKLNEAKLPSDRLRQLYVETEFDSATFDFVTTTPRWNALTSGMNWVMAWMYTKTDIMGYLGMGNMFILSTDMYRSLLRVNSTPSVMPSYTLPPAETSIDMFTDSIPVLPASHIRMGSLLDIGSGCGTTTLQLSPLFNETIATEASKGMIHSLGRKGIRAIYSSDISNCPELADKKHGFDVVSCLNVLDRCERPQSLLRDIKMYIKPGGRLLLAVVYPFHPYVEFGGDANNPFEPMAVNNNSVEEYVDTFVTSVFEPLGYRLQGFTKSPYISEGDQLYRNYVLVDVLFVLTVASEDDVVVNATNAPSSSSEQQAI
eukprot:gene4412-5168_t